jgi:hypothetical protein
MLNALPMSIFGPLSLLYWLYYTFIDPIVRLLGFSSAQDTTAVKHASNGTANGTVSGKVNGHTDDYVHLPEKA